MSVPQILLMMPFLPTATHAGNVFVSELLRGYPSDKLCCFSVASNNSGENPPLEYEGFPLKWLPQPAEAGITRLGKPVAHLHTLAVQLYLRYIRVPKMVKQAVDFGRRYCIDLVWVILHHHPTMLYMAKAVAETLGVPLVTLVMDPPQQFIVNHHLQGRIGRFINRMIDNALAETLRISVNRGTASEGMQTEYKQRYGVDSVVLIHGLPAHLRQPQSTELTQPDRLIIGFAGSLYAKQEFQALVTALQTVNWCIEGRQVIIRFLGGAVNLSTQDKTYIEYLGWRTQEETLYELSQVDVTYLPYWFDEAYRYSVRLCFPNKLSTYLAAGRPVFYHGPPDATPVKFLQRFPAGLGCHSLEPTEIINQLRRFVIDREFYAQAVRETHVAFETELNLDIFRQRFASFLSISTEELIEKSQ